MKLIFSNQQDADEFVRELQVQKIDKDIFAPLVMQSLPRNAKPGAWKKMDGLAQVLDNMPGYEFALMLDAELRLNDCVGFTKLLTNLRKKHEKKIWYGDSTAPHG